MAFVRLHKDNVHVAELECTGRCLDVRTAMLNKDANLRDVYYDVAYSEAKAVAPLPSAFWQWVEENKAAREALLTTQWPVDYEVMR